MSIGKLNISSLTGNGLVPGAPDAAVSPDRQLKRLLIAEGGQQVYAETRRQLSDATRKGTAARARGPLYEDLANRFANVAASLITPQSLSSGPLNLGKGNGNATTGVDPNAPLNTQSFGLPVTAGTVNLTFQVNGGATTTRSVTIDPNQSLNANLQQFSAVTVGAQQPLKAEFTNGQVQFNVTSTAGAAFKFSIAAGTSNFFEAVTNGSRATDQTLTANAAVSSTPGTAFANLNVSFNGVSTTITNLDTTSAGLSPFQRATQLVSQINDGLAQSGIAQAGVQAVALSNGTIQLAGHEGKTPLTAGQQISITESGPGNSLGFSGGFTTNSTVGGGPDLTGPDATLARLAGALGLNAVNGGFSGSINGAKFNFSQDQSLSSVLKDISTSAAGVNAAYDPTTRKVTLTQQSATPAPIDVRDSAGNLFAALQLAPATGATTSSPAAGTLDNLKNIAQGLSDVLSLTETAVGKGGPFSGTPLLHDLAEAVGAQFKLSNDGQIHTLADLGFSRTNGQISVDAVRQQDLIAHHADEVVAAAGAIATQQVAPLAQAGQQALEDVISRTPADLRLAQQNVHARAEISRLQDRQNVLLSSAAAISGARQNVQAQRASLEKAAARLQSDTTSHVPPARSSLFTPILRHDQHVPLTPLADIGPLLPATLATATATQPTQPIAAPPAGLLSFGLATRNP